jgi:hypothetical protein
MLGARQERHLRLGRGHLESLVLDELLQSVDVVAVVVIDIVMSPV